MCKQEADAINRASDFEGRRAPYAPISALEQFFERIRDRGVPDRVDHNFLKKLNVASNNEYALLSALKFLEIVDDRGLPTHAYRRLQTTDSFQGTLSHLVETAYRSVFEVGADSWSFDDLVNYFRQASSPSQAKNAARFFRAVSHLAGIGHNRSSAREERVTQAEDEPSVASTRPPEGAPARDAVLVAKISLLDKLPPPREDWSAAEYQAICDRFLDMLRSLEPNTP